MWHIAVPLLCVVFTELHFSIYKYRMFSYVIFTSLEFSFILLIETDFLFGKLKD